MEGSATMNQPVSNHKSFEELYTETNQMVYYTALSILKNEADAQDIMQNSYISAFTKLDQLNDDSSFVPWLKKIVVNNCINMLNKKKPDLFSTEEEENFVLNSIIEQKEDFLPEEYMIQETKRRQVMDIINNLPDQQRTTIILFYYDELSVKEIAEVMKCGESTVTSRISYAKKSIKREVELLEKKGDKIYTVGPIPLLTKLFTEDAKSQAISQTLVDKILSQVVSSVPGSQCTASPEVGTASEVTKANLFAKLKAKFAGTSVKTKTLLAGVAAVIVIAGIVAPALVRNFAKEQSEHMTATAEPITNAAADTQENNSKRAAAYYTVLNSIISEYGLYTGTRTIEESQDLDYETWENSSGLAYAKLIDFDGEGNPELYLYYLMPYQQDKSNMDSPTLVQEIWCWDGYEAVRSYCEYYESTGSHLSNGADSYLSTVNGKTYLISTGQNMYGTGSDTGLLAGQNYGISALEFSGANTCTYSLMVELGTYSDGNVIYNYTISENDNVADSGNVSLGEIDTESNWDIYDPMVVKQWKDKYQANENDLLIAGGNYTVLGWTSNDVQSLLSSLHSDAGLLATFKNLPYLGDLAKCRITAEQAEAYIEVLNNAYGTSDHSLDSHAVLIDVSGDGVPILLIWYSNGGCSSEEEQWDIAGYECWTYQDGKTREIALDNDNLDLVSYDGETYLCDSNQPLDDLENQSTVLYKISNGSASLAHTIKKVVSDNFSNQDEDSQTQESLTDINSKQYTVDGATVSEEQYYAIVYEKMKYHSLISRIDLHFIGDDHGDSIYLALTKATITQTADMLSSLLPALQSSKVSEILTSDTEKWKTGYEKLIANLSSSAEANSDSFWTLIDLDFNGIPELQRTVTQKNAEGNEYTSTYLYYYKNNDMIVQQDNMGVNEGEKYSYLENADQWVSTYEISMPVLGGSEKVYSTVINKYSLHSIDPIILSMHFTKRVIYEESGNISENYFCLNGGFEEKITKDQYEAVISGYTDGAVSVDGVISQWMGNKLPSNTTDMSAIWKFINSFEVIDPLKT